MNSITPLLAIYLSNCQYNQQIKSIDFEVPISDYTLLITEYTEIHRIDLKHHNLMS